MRLFVYLFSVTVISSACLQAQNQKWIGKWKGKVTASAIGLDADNEEEVDPPWVEGTIAIDIAQTDAGVMVTYTVNAPGLSDGKGAIQFDKSQTTISATKFSGKSVWVFRGRKSCQETISGSLSTPESSCWERVYDTALLNESRSLPAGYARVECNVDLAIASKGKLTGGISLFQKEHSLDGTKLVGDGRIEFERLSAAK